VNPHVFRIQAHLHEQIPVDLRKIQYGFSGTADNLVALVLELPGDVVPDLVTTRPDRRSYRRAELAGRNARITGCSHRFADDPGQGATPSGVYGGGPTPLPCNEQNRYAVRGPHGYDLAVLRNYQRVGLDGLMKSRRQVVRVENPDAVDLLDRHELARIEALIPPAEPCNETFMLRPKAEQIPPR
jgi:hypothetical protein